VAALLAASEPAFTALKIGGGAYLAYLGAQALRRAMLERRAEHAPSGEPRLPGIPPWLAYRQGLVSNLGNPKIAVFFTSLLPQFATRDGHTSFASLLLLGLLFAAMTLAWLACYAVAVDTARDVVRRAPVRRVLDGVMGAVLVALGLRLALASRQ
jgi:threonine/homoserine/homoserine lactone efflux protein